MAAGDKNAYWCPECEQYLVTVDTVEGVTPAMLACRATDGCDGMMRSQFYPPEPWPATDPDGRSIPSEPTHEWYRPSLAWARRRGGQTLAHVQNGGLILREIRGLS